MTATDLPNPLGLTSDAFVARCSSLSREQALGLYRSVFRTGRFGLLSTAGIQAADTRFAPPTRIMCEETTEGPTFKFLMDVAGPTRGRLAAEPRLETLTVESVLIPMIGRLGRRTYTLCVSSQVGCAMGCDFCETAQMGLVRHLEPEEIVAQWFAATHLVDRPKDCPITNLVFMGMGEPLDNFDNVSAAIRILCDHNGPSLGASNITVSTVGRIDGLARLAAFARQPGFHRLGLAVSINAPNDHIRSRLMPVNRAMPMNALRDALLQYPMRTGGKICFEYVLIPGVNDADEHALELADFLAPFGPPPGRTVPLGLLNLIPYNPRRNSPWPAPDEADVARFMGLLSAAGVYVKRRRTKGRAMMGACGQLGAAHIRDRTYVEPTIEHSTDHTPIARRRSPHHDLAT